MNTIKVYTSSSGRRFFLPYPLPPGKSGEFEITHVKEKKGTKLTVVGARNAIFMGLKQAKIILDDDTWVHWLSQKNGTKSGTWMSTMPQEVEQHTRQLQNAHGRVLVGGLGLGLAVALLQENPNVTEVVVVEISKNVIELVRPYLAPVCEKCTWFVHRDLYKHLDVCRANRFKYDFAFYDIWCPTGQTVLCEHVIPLRRASMGVVPQNQIECWNEEEMLGQVRFGLSHVWNIINGNGLPGDKVNVRSRDFRRRYKQSNPECWPFFNRLSQQKISEARMTQLMNGYIRALKDPVVFDLAWKRWSK